MILYRLLLSLFLAIVMTLPVSSTAAQTGVETIRFNTYAEAEARRQEVIRFLWADGLPGRQPDAVAQDINAPDFWGWPNLATTHRLTVHQNCLPDNQMYHLVPTKRIGRAILHQSGHGDGTILAHDIRVEKRLVSAGFDVIHIDMMQGAVCNGVWVGHDDEELTTPQKHGMAYHLESPILAINYLRQKYPTIPIAMAGRSGGGWTTDWIAAIDPRVNAAYPCCGSVPIPSRGRAWGPAYPTESYGDWEQWDAEAYGGPNAMDPRSLPGVVNYSELYTLGAIPSGRSVVQIINPDDGCCFQSDRRAEYAPNVKAKVAQLGAGGSYDSILDITQYHEHTLSDPAVEAIIRHQIEIALYGQSASMSITTPHRCFPRTPIQYQLGFEANNIVRARMYTSYGNIQAVKVTSLTNATEVHPPVLSGALSDLVVMKIDPTQPIELRFTVTDECGTIPFVIDA